MKYIQTFFYEDSTDPFKNSCGWVSPKFHLMGWTLSCLTLKHALGKVELYSNKIGIELLINKLNLPYEEVHEIDSTFHLPHPQLWALPKIRTYSLQKRPFLHIDGDIFMFDKIPAELQEANIVAQNIESFTNFYYDFMPAIKENFQYIPSDVVEDFKSMRNLKALNAGILGGNNTHFFKEYSEEAFNYIYNNIDSLSQINVHNFNVFFEQHLCYKMAEQQKVKIEYLLKPMYCDNGYIDLAEFHKISSGECKYIHLLGNYKRDLFTCMQMEKALMSLYPTFHSKVIELFKEENPFNINDASFSNSFNYGKGRINNVLDEINRNIKGEIGMEEDFKSWRYSILTHTQTFSHISNEDLKARDINSFDWYCRIYDKKQSTQIKRSPLIRVFSSQYDWARFFRSKFPSGNSYYEMSKSELCKGIYYTLFVKETDEYYFSIYDIDELEYIILEDLRVPISFKQLFDKMLIYLDNEGLENVNKFKLLIMQYIERLITFKAIMPL